MTNVKLLNAALFLLLLNFTLQAQSIPQKFFDALIYDKEIISEFINKDELAKSKRLGISYDGVKRKALLTYEIPSEIKDGIVSGKYKYEIKELPFADTYTEVTFSVPEINFKKIYYFDNGFVYSSTYHTWGWQKKESKYFNFRLQEPKYFNDYCIKRLDDFVDMMADTLGFTSVERELLENEKLFYTFCSDEKEVENITGFRSKGMAILASDEVITAYQTHFHEVAHLLINYKLKNLSIYTLPFFLEGFAVAMGGRGGMAPRVVTDIGAYLQTTGFLTYDSILTNEQFYSNDANMTYALSGLYNSFLFNELGMEKYLELYKKINGDLDHVKSITKQQIELPAQEKFISYLTAYNNEKIMFVDEKDTTEPLWIPLMNGNFVFKENYIKIYVVDKFKVGFLNITIDSSYVSRKYEEIYKQTNNKYSKYLITASANSIDIYNLFNDELIYSYSKGLSISPVIIPKNRRHSNNYYNFFIHGKLFNDDFNNTFVLSDTN